MTSSLIDDCDYRISINTKKMQNELDASNFKGAFKCAIEICSELSISGIPPKEYYGLYILVCNKLNILSMYLQDEFKKGNKIKNLYEMAQYSEKLLPRLYLLVTVGVVYIKCSDYSKIEIMNDLVEMCRGAQHPIRGLFLRAYLLQSIDKTLLPDKKGERYEKVPGQIDNRGENELNVYDSINFILSNLIEMNKLWVRMQYQGLSKEKLKREQERDELKILVGTNLTRLSQLESLDIDCYKNFVLPHIMNQIAQCRDKLAQEYLLEIITQVFPDEFHLETIDEIFIACMSVVPEVKIRKIVCSLINRLSMIVANSPENNQCSLLKKNLVDFPLGEGDPESTYVQEMAFDREATDFEDKRLIIGYLAKQIGKLLWHVKVEQLESEGLLPSDIAIIYHHLASMAMYLIEGKSCHNFIDYCLKCAAIFIKRIGFDCLKSHTALTNEVISLLKRPLDGGIIGLENNSVEDHHKFSHRTSNLNLMIPLKSLCSINDIFKMDGYKALIDLLDSQTSKRSCAMQIMRSFREKNHAECKEENETDELLDASRIVNQRQLDGLLNLMRIITSHECDSNSDEDEEVFIEEMALISGCIHLIGKSEPTTLDDCVENFNFLQTTASSLIRFACSKSKNISDVNVIQQNIPEADLVAYNTFPAIVYQLNNNLTHFNKVAKEGENKDVWEEHVVKCINFIHTCIKRIISTSNHETAIRLLLDSAVNIDQIDFKRRSSLVYEFISHTFVLSEDGGIDSKTQNVALTLIISTMTMISNMDEDSFNVLKKQCFRASNHLLRKPDQAKAIMLCTRLYWNIDEQLGPVIKNEDQLKSLLDKALQISNECMGICVQAQLKIDILNYYMTYRLKEYSGITNENIEELIEIIASLLKQVEKDQSTILNIRYLQNTIKFVKIKHEEKLIDINLDKFNHILQL